MNLPYHVKGYTLIEQLGMGGFSTVYKAVHNISKLFVAIKCFTKKTLKPEHLTLINNEIKFLRMIDHPLIASFFECFEDEEYIFLAIEYAEKGNLLQFINSQEQLQEKLIKKIFVQLIISLDYLHNTMKLAHRDIKPENIVFDKHMNIKIIDFGFTDNIGTNEDFFNYGSLSYVSPEIVKRECNDYRADIWAAGIILYSMSFGAFPFYAESHDALFYQILNSSPVYPAHSNPEVRNLISSLLEKDPAQRLTTSEILQSSWIEGTSELKLFQTISSNPKFSIANTIMNDSSIFNKVSYNINPDDFNVCLRIFAKNRIISCFDRHVKPLSMAQRQTNSAPKIIVAPQNKSDVNFILKLAIKRRNSLFKNHTTTSNVQFPSS